MKRYALHSHTFEPYTCGGTKTSEVSWEIKTSSGVVVASGSGAMLVIGHLLSVAHQVLCHLSQRYQLMSPQRLTWASRQPTLYVRTTYEPTTPSAVLRSGPRHLPTYEPTALPTYGPTLLPTRAPTASPSSQPFQAADVNTFCGATLWPWRYQLMSRQRSNLWAYIAPFAESYPSHR